MWWFLGSVLIACAALTYSITYGWRQGEDEVFSRRLYGDLRYAEAHRRENGGFAIFFAGLFGLGGGPITLVIVWRLSGFGQHGLRWR